MLFNVSTIDAQPDRILVQTRPFPFGAASILDTGNLHPRRIYCVESVENAEERNESRTFYKVSLEGPDGSTADVVGRLAHRSHAEYIAKHLDNYYKYLPGLSVEGATGSHVLYHAVGTLGLQVSHGGPGVYEKERTGRSPNSCLSVETNYQQKDEPREGTTEEIGTATAGL